MRCVPSRWSRRSRPCFPTFRNRRFATTCFAPAAPRRPASASCRMDTFLWYVGASHTAATPLPGRRRDAARRQRTSSGDDDDAARAVDRELRIDGDHAGPDQALPPRRARGKRRCGTQRRRAGQVPVGGTASGPRKGAPGAQGANDFAGAQVCLTRAHPGACSNAKLVRPRRRMPTLPLYNVPGVHSSVAPSHYQTTFMP